MSSVPTVPTLSCQMTRLYCPRCRRWMGIVYQCESCIQDLACPKCNGPVQEHDDDTTTLTPVMSYGPWWAKRDDLACCTDPAEYPGGSKVRQYAAMIARSPQAAPMVVGCSADSAMQIYVAAAARQTGRGARVFTARRRQRSAATAYAAQYVDVVELAPGYLSQCRFQAKTYGKELAAVVRWDVAGAIDDAAAQVANLPATGLKRIVIATGSGLTAIGVLLGLQRAGRLDVDVLSVAVSPMASEHAIKARASALAPKGAELPRFRLQRAPQPYGEAVFACLPDGALLDPYYAAKCLPYVAPGDCFWIPGIRPLAAMPDTIRALYREVTR